MDKELMKNFGLTVAKFLETEEGRKAVAQKIVQYVSNEVEQRDLSGLILDVVNVSLGQTYEWVYRGKLQAYWHEPGSYAPRTAMTQKVFTIPTKMISANPEYEIGQLKAGRYGTMQDQIAAARDAIVGQINAMVFNTIVGSITSSKNNYAAVALTAANATNVANFKTALDRAVRWVKDRPGGARAIVARATTIDFIGDFSNSNNNVWSPSMVEDYMKRGIVSSYKGVPIIPLQQYIDKYDKPTIPENEVLVVGYNLGKVVIEEELQQMSDIDVNTLIWNVHMWKRIGAGLLFPDNAYRIKIG